MPGEPPLPERLACLERAYGDTLARIERTPDGPLVHLRDGRTARWDDGRAKSPAERLADPDLEDTLATPYPAGAPLGPPPAGSDPGRVRHRALLEAAWGHDPREVRARLRSVDWPFQRRPVRFHAAHGAADALVRVARRLATLPAAARRCVAPTRGTFHWRTIRGTDRRSPHSWGIAIDLRCGDYWRWARPFRGAWRNRMPAEVVRAFEGERFVWGGRWHHYDTLHFEYRPELFAPACRPR